MMPEEKKRILIIDDDVDMRMSFAKVFKALGLEVIEAEDGRMGLRQWRESYPIDYVLTDYQMPWKNGVEVCIEIRKTLKSMKLPIKTKIVMMSADPPKLPKEIADIPILLKGTIRTADLLEKLGIEKRP